MSLKIILSTILSICILTVSFSYYYSDKNTSQRDFVHMLNTHTTDLQIIRNYLKHHEQDNSLLYLNAIQLAANLDNSYLDSVLDYYTTGRLILKTDTARLITSKLPSDSVKLNHAAGNIYATHEFQLYNPSKAVKHLEYAALRGDTNAAATLANVYANAKCYIEAITWARVANKRDNSSDCSRLPVNINILSDEELDATIKNENELARADRENRLPLLIYSKYCSIRDSN